MIESLRTTQIAFLICNAVFVSGRAEERYKKSSCKGTCKGKSYETTSENIVLGTRPSCLPSSVRPFFYTDNRVLLYYAVTRVIFVVSMLNFNFSIPISGNSQLLIICS